MQDPLAHVASLDAPVEAAREDSATARNALASAAAREFVRRLPPVVGYAVPGMSTIVLLGFALRITVMQSFFPRLVTMKAYAAFALAACSVALLVWQRSGQNVSAALARALGVVIMPDMTGVVLAETIRAKIPRMRVLLTSGFTHGRLRVEEGLGEGMAFLEKPYTLASLANAVRALMRAESDGARGVVIE